MRFITKTLVTSLAVLLAAYLLSNHGISINSSVTAVMVALVLGLLNSFVKPVLIILTIPITIFSLGLFLIVINVFIVEMTSAIVKDFKVESWFAALLFSLIVSITSSFIEKLINKNTTNHQEETEEF